MPTLDLSEDELLLATVRPATRSDQGKENRDPESSFFRKDVRGARRPTSLVDLSESPPSAIRHARAATDAANKRPRPTIAVATSIDRPVSVSSTSENDQGWHPRYRPDNHRVTIVSEDGKAFSVESKALSRRSTVFKDMLDVAQPGQKDATESITIDAPAVVVELFLDLLLAWSDISSTPLQTDVRATHTLLRLADKYGSDEIEKLAEKRVGQLDPWQVLKFAEEVDDLKLARMAIHQLPITVGTAFWESAEVLTPAWQIALVRSLAPNIALRDTANKDPYHMILKSRKSAAERFDPHGHNKVSHQPKKKVKLSTDASATGTKVKKRK